MKKISLDKINEKALYRVVQIEELPHLFYIHTDFDVDYEISIKQSTALVQSGCYTLNIRNIWGQKSPKLHLWDWAYDCTRSEELEKEIAEGWTDEYGFVYSQDRKRLLKAPPEWKEYWIPEGVEKIDRLAFIGCKYEDLHIPYTCKTEEWPLEECPVYGSERVQGCIWPWEKPYSEKNSEFYL
jgi:hypothetical protein